MKRYKVYKDSNSFSLTQFSKTGKRDGDRIWFLRNGIKHYQTKCKNGLWNGLIKVWRTSSKNWHFRFCKEGEAQGIQIFFK